MAAELLECVGFARVQAAKALAFVGRAYEFAVCAAIIVKKPQFSVAYRVTGQKKKHYLLETNLK